MMFLLDPILKAGNFLVRKILRSRCHWLLSFEVVMLEITGRRSGKRYLVPVSYREFDGGISILTYRRRKWWRNLRDGDEIAIWLRGDRVHAAVEIITDDVETITHGLRERNLMRKAIAKTDASESLMIRLHTRL